MTIRRLVIAALLASTGAAHAGTIPATASSPKIVSGWTTGNGTDVLGSGVLQGNLNLIGGVSYTSGGGANASLADVLLGKVAGTVGEVGGKTTLFFQRGIEANYLLASGHGVLAATVGPGKSVVGSADGAVISDGLAYVPVNSGASPGPVFGGGFPAFPGGVVGGGGTSSGGSSGGGSSGGSSSGGSFSGGSGGGSFGGGSGGGSFGGGSGTGSSGGGSGGAQQDSVIVPVTPSLPPLSGITQPAAVVPLPTAIVPMAEVPEPSSIALMLAGIMGAAAFARRRKD